MTRAPQQLAQHGAAAPDRDYVHTLHLWDAATPIRGEQPPFSVISAVSFDDEEYPALGVELLAFTAGARSPLVAHLRAFAEDVDYDPERRRVLLRERDVLVPYWPDGAPHAQWAIRWYGLDQNLLAGPAGALTAEVDIYIAGLHTRTGPGPTPNKGLKYPDDQGARA